MARCTYEGTVFAIEKECYALELIEENKIKFGAYNISVINAVAPDGLDELPAADKVFIGGSSGNLKEIIRKIMTKNEYVKVVVNAITLETLNEAIQCFNEMKLSTDIICVNVSKSEKIGNYNMMKAQNAIYIISGVKQDGES
jgi:precorrin-6Y C5,15-methyltransferase (decarboxylating)